ncbi:MAG: V-type ATPase subunit [Candidatus Omnitrophota bacterium]
MFDLTKYSFVNSKIRAMLSYLLSPAHFERLVEAKDTSEMMDIFKGTAYGVIVERLGRGHIELENLEKELIKEDLRIFRKVYDMFSTKEEKNFVAQLMERYEIEELKVVLRAWHKKIAINLNDYITSDTINFCIDFEKILAAQSIEEIIILLDHTPYKQSLLEAREKFKKQGSSFCLEVALDRSYYERLLATINKFSLSDKKVARKLLGLEIDIENINSLIRLKKYYSLGTEAIMEAVMPGGERIDEKDIEKFYSTGGLSKIVEGIGLVPHIKIKNFDDENAYSIGNFLYEVLLHQVKKVLGGFPFTIGTTMGYLILKRRETHNIISLFYSKALGVKKDETSSLLNM